MIKILHVIGKMDRAGAESMIMSYYRAIDRTKFQFDFLVQTEEEADESIMVVSEKLSGGSKRTAHGAFPETWNQCGANL